MKKNLGGLYGTAGKNEQHFEKKHVNWLFCGTSLSYLYEIKLKHTRDIGGLNDLSVVSMKHRYKVDFIETNLNQNDENFWIFEIFKMEPKSIR